MATTLGDQRTRARYLLNDRNRAEYAVDTPALDRAIRSKVRLLSSMLRLGDETVTLNLTTASDTYPLSGTTIRQVQHLRHSSQPGQIIQIVSREQFQRLRVGMYDASKFKGYPSRATLSEGTDQVLDVIFHLWPGQDYTVEVLLNRFPTAPTLEADSLPLDELAAECLSYMVASELAAIGKDKDLSGEYAQTASMLLQEQRKRRNGLSGIGMVRRGRAW